MHDFFATPVTIGLVVVYWISQFVGTLLLGIACAFWRGFRRTTEPGT